MSLFKLLAAGLLLWMAVIDASYAEPYLAVKTGLKCMSCHVNPTGGGKRNEFGGIYGQTGLYQGNDDSQALLVTRISEFLAVGGDGRMEADYTGVEGRKDAFEFDVKSAKLYFEFNLIPDRFTYYVDEQVAPGGALNRESYALYWSKDHRYYLKAGRMFLPYGLRLEDDSAFIRQVSGINFTTPDTGVEAGLELNAWSLNLAISNGAGGGSENNTAKQYSLRAEYIRPGWRGGASYNLNQGDEDDDRAMMNAFAGIKTGPVAWLAEYDFIRDDAPSENRVEQEIGLLEANTEVLDGHNVKLTYEYLDPNIDVDEDERERYSVVWEFVPLRFSQIRLGYRKLNGIPQNELQNSSEFFLQNHVYF